MRIFSGGNGRLEAKKEVARRLNAVRVLCQADATLKIFLMPAEFFKAMITLGKRTCRLIQIAAWIDFGRTHPCAYCIRYQQAVSHFTRVEGAAANRMLEMTIS